MDYNCTTMLNENISYIILAKWAVLLFCKLGVKASLRTRRIYELMFYFLWCMRPARFPKYPADLARVGQSQPLIWYGTGFIRWQRSGLWERCWAIFINNPDVSHLLMLWLVVGLSRQGRNPWPTTVQMSWVAASSVSSKQMFSQRI